MPATGYLMYDMSIPVLSPMLKNIATILTKAENHAKEKGYDPANLLGFRLAPDMFDLTRQVQIMTDNAKGAAFRLAGKEVPALADGEKSFGELVARIDQVRDWLKTFKPEDFDGAETREIVIKLRSGPLTFNGLDYLNRFAMPNFYFHATTAYAILRHNGVPVGKGDFLGG